MRREAPTREPTRPSRSRAQVRGSQRMSCCTVGPRSLDSHSLELRVSKPRAFCVFASECPLSSTSPRGWAHLSKGYIYIYIYMYIYIYIHVHYTYIYIYIYIFIEREREMCRCALNLSWAVMGPHGPCLTTDCDIWLLDTTNLRTKIMEFRGFDSSIMLIIRGGIVMSIGNFPGSLESTSLSRDTQY